MIQNEEKQGWHYLAIKNTINFIKRNNKRNKIMQIFVV